MSKLVSTREAVAEMKKHFPTSMPQKPIAISAAENACRGRVFRRVIADPPPHFFGTAEDWRKGYEEARKYFGSVCGQNLGV
jgi:hypothetical protein